VLVLLLVVIVVSSHAAWQPQPARWRPRPRQCTTTPPPTTTITTTTTTTSRAVFVALAGKEASPSERSGTLQHSSVPAETSSAADSLLSALDVWMREQTIESILPKEQAKALLCDLRDDRRFWAQQRRQYSLVWFSFEASLRVEERPLSALLGNGTSRRLLDAVEEMDEDPALVYAVLRSEIVEQLIGKVLYEGIFEFVQRADLLGSVIDQLPVLGAIRMQMIRTAREQVDSLLGESVTRFLGEYTTSAGESAAAFLLAPDTAPSRRRARRAAAAKLLSTPVRLLVPEMEMEVALLRDAVWSAVQEFRLPHETALVDRLYDEFGHQPFTILLPSSAAASRGDAPLFERGRSVLLSLIERFLTSPGWSRWAASADKPTAPEWPRGMRPLADAAEDNLAPPTEPQPQKPKNSKATQAPAPPPDSWDGWD